MQLTDFITDKNSIIFVLLFARFSGFFAFMPFFSHANISINIKTAIALFFTIFFFPMAKIEFFPQNISMLTLMVLSELMIGFLSGVILNFAFYAISFAGSQISTIMGFSLANVFDPISGQTSPLISQMLTLFSLLFFLAFDGHHLILLFLSKSINHIELGSFSPTTHMIKLIIYSVLNMFKMGLILAFPIIAISLLADIIFGMLMKTMPQFNLLVVGFPIKIFLSMAVIIAILHSLLTIFKNDFMKLFELLKFFF